MKILAKRIAGAAAIGAAMLIGSGLSAQAGYVVTVEQVGNDVVATGSGPIDLTGLEFLTAARIGTAGIIPVGSELGGAIFTGPAAEPPLHDIYFAVTFTSPGPFGSGSGTSASSGTGDFVSVTAVAGPTGTFPAFGVPLGYVSDSPLSDTSTYNNQSFASIGVTPGTYEYTWGTGGNQNFTVQIVPAAAVPEPSSLLLLGGVLAGLLGVRSRRRRWHY